MFYIMPSRDESVVFFDAWVDAERLLAWLERSKSFGANMTHATVAAAGIALSATPRMNRFVAGKRLYQRKKRFITFSMTRAKLDREAQLATVKLELRDGETFPEMCARINDQIGEERSGRRTRGDKEVDLFNLLPRPLLWGAAQIMRCLDWFNLMPAAFVDPDPMHTSIFIANLGSLDMAPGYHHLFEYGTCPLFIMVGRVEEVPAVVDGQVVARRRLHVRFTYDERIDHGLNARFGIEAFRRVLHDPERYLGGIEGAPAMWPREDWEDVRPEPGKVKAAGG